MTDTYPRAVSARAQMQRAHDARTAFVVRHYDHKPLVKLAGEAWDAGNVVSSVDTFGRDSVDVRGVASRMVLAAALEVEHKAWVTLGAWEDDNIGDSYQVKNYGRLVLDYLDILIAAGYEPNDTEASRIEALRKALTRKRRTRKQNT